MSSVRPAVVLSSLRAEGGPALAADLCAEWAAHDPVVLLLNGDDMTMKDRFDSLGVPVELVDVGLVTPKRYPAIAARMRRAIEKHRVDAIVSIPNGVHGAIFAGAAMAGVRSRVVHVGNYPWHWQADFWKYRLLMRASAPVTPDLVCVTEHVAEGVRSHFGSVAKRVHVIANGIDLRAFPFRGTPAPAPGGRPVRVLMVGRLDPGKDHKTLISAIAVLRARGIPVELSVAGEGSLQAELEAYVCERGLASEVTFLGARRDIPQLLADADVFAFSVRPEEGLGIALVEAMAVGVPIVATDVGACREVLDGGRCGALVRQNDVEKLADAIEASVRRPAATVVRAARERAERTYSRAAMARAYGALCGL